jgi:hypothetical protein
MNPKTDPTAAEAGVDNSNSSLKYNATALDVVNSTPKQHPSLRNGHKVRQQ